ncbi:MAG: hypothetical protein L0177_17855 [Chloroflexi bacterium]|nr:hypothetical protein [Chloroflexota bacterium]
MELSAIVGVEDHYEGIGFDISHRNPMPHTFTVKTRASGKPWKYSHIVAQRGALRIELHMNLCVRSAHDKGIYCVDVGITTPGAVPAADTVTKWECVENEHLLSFAEVKRLPVYPMLLAHFIGIVHEITPQFLGSKRRPGFGHSDMIPPTLIVLGRFSGNAKQIIDSYPKRGIQVHVAHEYDTRVARARLTLGSPLYYPWEV